MTASLPDRLRKAADELESLRLAEDAALMREAAEALSDTDPQGTIMHRMAPAVRLYLHHQPDTGATDVRVEVGEDDQGRRLFSTAGWPHGPRSFRPVAFERPTLHVIDPGMEPPLYCPPIPDAEMARLLGIRP